jgi:hypothetical protein
MKLQGMTNVEWWSRFAQSFKIDRIHYSMFDAYSPPEDSLVSFIDLTGRFFGQRRR